MVIYQSLVNRYVRPVIERHEARGRAQGRAEGAQVQNDLWNAWLQRKEAAEAQGIEFNEPPPRTMALWGNGALVLKFRQLPW